MDKKIIKICSFIFSIFAFLLIISINNENANAYSATEVSINGGTVKLDHSIKGINYLGTKVNNLESAFNKMADKGPNKVKLGTSGMDFSRLSTGGEHLQGGARYGDYTILASNHKKKKGTLFIFKNEKLVQQVKLPYDHPGGIDVCGDLLAVGSTDEGDYKNKLYTRLYDLRPIKDGKEPIELFKFKGFAELSVGISSFKQSGKDMIAIAGDSGQIMMAEFPNDGQTFTWTYYNKKGDSLPGSRQNCALITDKNESLYFCVLEDVDVKKKILFWTTSIRMEDYANLYKLTFDTNSKTVTIKKVNRRGITFRTGLGKTQIYEHYRWSSHIGAVDQNSLMTFATASIPGIAYVKDSNIAVYYHYNSTKPKF